MMPVHRQWVNEEHKGQIKKHLKKMEIHIAKFISCSNSRSRREVHIKSYLKKQKNSQKTTTT